MKSDVQKILGPSGKIPQPKLNVDQLSDEWQKRRYEAQVALSAAAQKFYAALKAMEKSRDGQKQVLDQMSSSTFGLNESKPDEKKKIEQAHKVLDSFLNADIRANVQYLDRWGKVYEVIRNVD